jgi:cell division protein FtsI/penicillin-binding protein 2
MMGSGIYQASTSGSINPPTIFKKQISKSNTEISQSTATSVLKGMQKVVMSSEKGWIGDGTANGAFTRVFGKSCGDNCPIFAKTGTVSYQDKVYGGTTLFTGIVLTNELRQLKDPESKGNKRNLAIGVICKAKNKNTEHLASKLGMLAIKEIALHD